MRASKIPNGTICLGKKDRKKMRRPKQGFPSKMGEWVIYLSTEFVSNPMQSCHLVPFIEARDADEDNGKHTWFTSVGSLQKGL